MGEPGVGTAQLFRDVRVECGEPANMKLLGDGVAPGESRRRVSTPVEWFLGYYDRLRYERGGVAVVAGVRIADLTEGRLVVVEHRRIQLIVAVNRARVGVNEQLRRIESVAGGGIPRPVYTESIALTWFEVGDRAVPDIECPRRQWVTGFVSVLVEQTDVNSVGIGGADCEVRRFWSPRCARRAPMPGPGYRAGSHGR